MEELRKLGDRFRRLAARPDGSTKSLAFACEDGGQLLVQLSEAGRLPFKLPAPKPGGAISDYVGIEWAVRWDACVAAMAMGNPHCIEWKQTAENIRIGSTSHDTWRDRAERYGAFCDLLAAELEDDGEGGAAGNEVTGKRMPGTGVRKVINMIRRGKSNDDICRAIPDKSVDAIKRIRCDLGKGLFDLS